MIDRYLPLLPPATDSAHDIAHIRRVWANARTLAEDLPADEQVLAAATALHDMVSLPKDHPERSHSSRLAAQAAVEALRRGGFPQIKLKAVAHAIEAHSFSAGITPLTPEAQVLRDADRLDALGHIGIARLFAVTGAMGREFYDPDDPYAQNRPLDQARYAFDHVQAKLLTLQDDMCTEQGRAVARDRTKMLRHFLNALAREIGLDPTPGFG